MNKLIMIGIASLTMAVNCLAGDVYLIGNRDSLVTANRGDLENIMALNARHMKQAVRDYYNRLRQQGALFNMQPGDRVEVTEYFPDNTVKIEWSNGTLRGYISKDDLVSYLGSTVPRSNTSIWTNDSNN